jgi:SOH1
MSRLPGIPALFVICTEIWTVFSPLHSKFRPRFEAQTTNSISNIFHPLSIHTSLRAPVSYNTVLAQNQYLDDPAFLRYLSYLLYWTDPSYAKFVVFPHALYFLRLLQHAKFREALKSPQYALILHQQQGYHWQFSASPDFRRRNPGDAMPTGPPPAGDEQMSMLAPSPAFQDQSRSPEWQTPAQTPARSQTPGPSHSATTSPARTYS